MAGRCFKISSDVVISDTGKIAAARIARRLEEIFPRGLVCKRHIEVCAAARTIGIRLRHKGRKPTMLSRDLMRHEAEEHIPIRHRQCVGVLEVDLELADAVLVIERIDIPAEMVHRLHEFEQPSAIIQTTCHVVGGLGQIVTRRHRTEADRLVIAEDVEFSLDTEIGHVAHLIGQSESTL